MIIAAKHTKKPAHCSVTYGVCFKSQNHKHFSLIPTQSPIFLILIPNILKSCTIVNAIVRLIQSSNVVQSQLYAKCVFVFKHPITKKKSLVFFPSEDFVLVVILIKKKIICTNCCNSITSLIYTVMNAVDGRIFGVTCAAKDFRRVHIWNGIRSLAFAWKAIYNYLCWSIEIWSADRSTQEKNKQMMNGTKTETTQRVEYKEKKNLLNVNHIRFHYNDIPK